MNIWQQIFVSVIGLLVVLVLYIAVPKLVNYLKVPEHLPHRILITSNVKVRDTCICACIINNMYKKRLVNLLVKPNQGHLMRNL